MSDEDSPALKLLGLVWRETKFRSWIRLNHTMQDALSLAITSGMRFEVGDFERMLGRFSGSHWFGSNAEGWIYGAAVRHGNTSACKAWEHLVGRKPFIYEGKRLHEGARIDPSDLDGAGGHPAFVTSFASDGKSLIACTYHVAVPVKDGSGRLIRQPGAKIKRRITLTLKEVRAMERARKDRVRAAKGEK